MSVQRVCMPQSLFQALLQPCTKWLKLKTVVQPRQKAIAKFKNSPDSILRTGPRCGIPQHSPPGRCAGPNDHGMSWARLREWRGCKSGKFSCFVVSSCYECPYAILVVRLPLPFCFRHASASDDETFARARQCGWTKVCLSTYPPIFPSIHTNR